VAPLAKLVPNPHHHHFTIRKLRFRLSLRPLVDDVLPRAAFVLVLRLPTFRASSRQDPGEGEEDAKRDEPTDEGKKRFHWEGRVKAEPVRASRNPGIRRSCCK
jgi:hypothetical protein